MSTRIAHQAVIDPRCELDQDVEIGPFCVVGRFARIGQGTRLGNGVAVVGNTTIGRNNVICTGAQLGISPERPSARADDAELVIGDGNIIREGVAIAGGNREQGMTTLVGNECSLQGGARIAEGCRLADGVEIGTGCLLGASTHVGSAAALRRGVITHDLVSVGSLAECGEGALIQHDVPPYLIFDGCPARAVGVNVSPLRAAEFPPYVIDALHETFRLVYQLKVGLDRVREMLRAKGQLHPAVNHVLTSLQLQHEGRHGRSRQLPRRLAA